MRIGYKIAIGLASGVALGFVTYKIIYNYRIKSANERFTPELEKENLIDNIIIIKNIDNSEANRNIYRAMSISELTNLLNTSNSGSTSSYGYSLETSSYSSLSNYSN